MTCLLMLSAYLLDMLIITIFLDNMFRGQKRYSNISYYFALCVVEILLFMNEYLVKTVDMPYAKAITMGISLFTTFFLCFFYKSSWQGKILATCIFQMLVSVGEIIFTYLISVINPDFLKVKNMNLLYNTMNNGSKVVLLILCLSIVFVRKRDSIISQWNYNMLLFSTPIITLAIYCILPLKKVYAEDAVFYNLLFISLAVLNVINFILIKNNQAFVAMKFANTQMEQQIRFQKEKYELLSESYRNNRRLIHDVKKHYFSIQEYIRCNNLQGLLEYTHSAIDDLESTYVKYNTGNLVIDSFLTNYDTVYEANHIHFSVHLNVDCGQIPIKDYDLCIVLGNLLDNALQANDKIEILEREVLIEIETTENSKFRIHVENPLSEQDSDEKKNILHHGYGLENVKKVVSENHGFVTIRTAEYFVIDILIPIIAEKDAFIH